MAERVYKSRRSPREKRLWRAPKGAKSSRSLRRPLPPPSAQSSSPSSARCRVPSCSSRPWTSAAAAAASSKRPASRARVEERRRRPRLLPPRCGFGRRRVSAASFPIKRRGRVEAALAPLHRPNPGHEKSFFPRLAAWIPQPGLGAGWIILEPVCGSSAALESRRVRVLVLQAGKPAQPTLQDCCGENKVKIGSIRHDGRLGLLTKK